MSEYTDILPGELPEDGLTVVKFSKQGCGPCRMLKPKFEELSKDESYEGKVNFLTINPQTHMEWIMKVGFSSVPTTVGFIDNEPVFKVTGVNIDDIKSSIEKYID